MTKLAGNYPSRSRNGKTELKILNQPEEQHRARYLTEGSRGSIKDGTGLGHPVVKLFGFNSCPVKLQCFIGHDKFIGVPHLFYQASRITGKNSTRCSITKVEGTAVITLDLTPENNMQTTIDCIGILKERNVDVEQKVLRLKSLNGGYDNDDSVAFPSKKRCAKCRLVFRCKVPGTNEILQAVSTPILCTQPVGTPEICKMSLAECKVGGGKELYLIGKNFLKDSKVIFKTENWCKYVEPDKEYLHSSHIICVIPPYDGPNHEYPGYFTVSISVRSGGKYSDSHSFTYINDSPTLSFGEVLVNHLHSPMINGNGVTTNDATPRYGLLETEDSMMKTISHMGDGHSNLIKDENSMFTMSPLSLLSSATVSPSTPQQLSQPSHPPPSQQQQAQGLTNSSQCVSASSVVTQSASQITADHILELTESANLSAPQQLMQSAPLPCTHTPTPMIIAKDEVSMSRSHSLDGAHMLQTNVLTVHSNGNTINLNSVSTGSDPSTVASVAASSPSMNGTVLTSTNGGMPTSGDSVGLVSSPTANSLPASSSPPRVQVGGGNNASVLNPSTMTNNVPIATVPNSGGGIMQATQSQITAMSQMSDTELIRLINPSTFDEFKEDVSMYNFACSTSSLYRK